MIYCSNVIQSWLQRVEQAAKCAFIASRFLLTLLYESLVALIQTKRLELRYQIKT